MEKTFRIPPGIFQETEWEINVNGVRSVYILAALPHKISKKAETEASAVYMVDSPLGGVYILQWGVPTGECTLSSGGVYAPQW